MKTSTHSILPAPRRCSVLALSFLGILAGWLPGLRAGGTEDFDPTGAAGHLSASTPSATGASFHLPPTPDAALEALDEHLAFSAFHGWFTARLSGLLDLEGYLLTRPAPALIETQHAFLFNPRLSFFIDANFGSRTYLFVQARIDRRFDPSDKPVQTRLDEYFLRETLLDHGPLTLALQAGKFATVVGNWTPRHLSWDNPFINAPLPYENVTSAADLSAPSSAAEFGFFRGGPSFKSTWVPVIWGPSYATGLAAAGQVLGHFDFAVEVKNAALSSRPEQWDATTRDWSHPTVSGRLGWRPGPDWNFGASGSEGAYMTDDSASSLPPGRGLGDYRQITFGQDVAYSHGHWQAWAEAFESRFEVPNTGNADTFAYYVEGRYQLDPQFWVGLRWNQQLRHDPRRIRRRTGLGERSLAHGPRGGLPFERAFPGEAAIHLRTRTRSRRRTQPTGGCCADHDEVLTAGVRAPLMRQGRRTGYAKARATTFRSVTGLLQSKVCRGTSHASPSGFKPFQARKNPTNDAMNIQAINTNASQPKNLALRPRWPVLVRALSGILLVGAALAPLHAATLNEGFGPLSLVEGATPVRGGCGRPLAACTCCGHTPDMEMNMPMGMGMDMDVGGPIMQSTVRLDAVGLNASPTMLTVTNVGTTAYSINSVNNPILTFVRGETYTFSINANGHPFYIKTVQGAGTGNAYTNGVTGSGTQVGTVTFTVPMDAPSTLFYDCANHSAMTNRIDVIPEPSTLAAITALGFVAVVARWRAGQKAA